MTAILSVASRRKGTDAGENEETVRMLYMRTRPREIRGRFRERGIFHWRPGPHNSWRYRGPTTAKSPYVLFFRMTVPLPNLRPVLKRRHMGEGCDFSKFAAGFANGGRDSPCPILHRDPKAQPPQNPHTFLYWPGSRRFRSLLPRKQKLAPRHSRS